MIPIQHILIFTLILFSIGVYGILTRRNLIGILMSVELMLNAVNINFLVFSRTSALSPETAQIFAIFVMALAAAAAAVGLAIVIAIHRTKKTILIDEINILKG